MNNKLYMEEKIRQKLYLMGYFDDEQIENFINDLTPIEIPTDEDIEEFSHTKYMEVEDSRWFEPLKVGAKWMRDKIEGNNEPN